MKKTEEFVPGTKNYDIFNLSAPYQNPYQSKKPRLLFVCSAGLLRSPTGAHVAQQLGFNSRSCGSSSYALIPLSTNLIMWAQHIYFVSEEVYSEALKTFSDTGFEDEIEAKKEVLDIPDTFNAYAEELQEEFKSILAPLTDRYANLLY